MPGRWRDAAIERHRDFHEDERALVLNPACEAFVDAAGFRLADSKGGLKACCPHSLHAAAGDVGIRVAGGGDNASESCRNESIGARAGASGVIAGLKGDVGGAPSEAVLFLIREGVLFGFAERDDLGVVEQVVLVPAFANDLAGAIENDATHGGVWRGDADAAAGEVEGALHPVCGLCRRYSCAGAVHRLQQEEV